MSVLSGSQTPDADRSAFMRAIALNYVIAGTDAHAKNYGLLHLPGGVYRMAPLYDVISALPYEDRHKDRKLAMSIAGEYRYDRISAADWAKEANDVRYDKDAAIGHVRDLLARVPEAATEILRECKAAGLLTASLDRLANLIERRCGELQRTYGREAA
jgi:serine/threonine-protein kinase HipA